MARPGIHVSRVDSFGLPVFWLPASRFSAAPLGSFSESSVCLVGFNSLLDGGVSS